MTAPASDATALIAAVPFAPSFVFEVNLALCGVAGTDNIGGYVRICDHEDNYVIVELLPEQNSLALRHLMAGQTWNNNLFRCTTWSDFSARDAYHHLRVERRSDDVRLFVDRVLLMSHSNIAATGGAAGIWTRNAAAAFDGIALTFVEQE